MDRKRRVFNVAAGSKIKHLKKPDGEPLWRADIQYDFLHAIFHSKERVFTNVYTKEPAQTFAEIYVDAMARSTKCSKILGDRLLSGGSAALNIAMVCILVNIGRMNTTLNFFPEMKAQLRTYHPIPSLQSSDQLQDKQLQDAPRLKSILKGACEDADGPESLVELEGRAAAGEPATNPINLIFILTNQSQEVEDKFFVDPFKFSDLIMTSRYSSPSRAKAFLWLCWAYLETNMSPEALAANPFGEGSVKVPALEPLNPAQVQLENVDTALEVNFGQQMLLQRIRYIETGTAQPPKHLNSAQSEAALTLPQAQSYRDKRYMYEFEKLLRERRISKRRKRHARTVLARQFAAIKEADPIYTSDTETVATAGSSPSLGLRQYGATPEDRTGDYGELFATACKVFRQINRPNTTVPPPVEPLRSAE